MMAFCSSLSLPQSLSLSSKSSDGGRHQARPFSISSRCRASADVPDFLSADWLESRQKRPFGPRLNFSAEEAVQYQLDALKYNDQPRPDYGVEVMYRFAGFDPFERSTYFGPFFDLGQFERFRRIFHHSTYRVLLGHKERRILSSLWVKELNFSAEPVQAKGLDSRFPPRGRRDIPIYNVSEGGWFMGRLLADRESASRRRWFCWRCSLLMCQSSCNILQVVIYK